MLQKRLLSALTAAFFLALAPMAAAVGFLSVIEDLPLAPGLTEAPGAVLFESPSGQIVDASASGDVAPQKVSDFYGETLPQLGWEKMADGRFRRDKEILRIDVDGQKRPTIVHFSVVPQ